MSTQQQSSEAASASSNEAEASILRRFSSGMATARSWDEDADLLREARSKIPFDLLVSPDADDGGPRPPPCGSDDMLFPPVGLAIASNDDERKDYRRYLRPDDHKYEGDDLFLKRLTLWFQRDFMTWVNAPPCKFCGCEPKQMKSVDTRPPMTDEEKAGGASRVEVYNCPLCNTETTFPRYNSPRKLLETRKGRCGEYANLFGLMCRSAGFETRYVLDLTDHVWVECWSFRSDRWIMADSCEGKIDVPGMYERGWGKKLSHIFAFNSGHGEDYPSMVDVTMRYTRKFNEDEFQSRRAEFCPGGESVLERLVARTNVSLRSSFGKKISPGREAELERRLKNETEFFHRSQNLGWDNENPDECEGRTSGSLAWRASRDELGTALQRPPSSRNLGGKDDAGGVGGGEVSVGGSYLVESFLPNASCDVVSITARCVVSPGTSSSSGADGDGDGRGEGVPTTRHPGAITVSGVRCAVGDPGLNVVTVDEVTGCILQSRLFRTWSSAGKFVDTVPDGRIVAISLVGHVAARMVSSESGGEEEAPSSTKRTEESSSEIASSFHRLGGFPTTGNLSMVAYVGQAGFHPGWASAAVKGEANHMGMAWPGSLGVHVSLRLDAGGDATPQIALKEDRNLLPRVFSARVPEGVMPLKTQLLASEEQKMKAAQSALDGNAAYVGYMTRPGHAIYLLAASAFPFVNEANNAGWVIRRYLPKEIVPETTLASIPTDIPTDVGFFTGLLGPALLRSSASSAAAVGVSTSSALEGKRLVALYFSAHWCPPCKGFTPMLAEFYETIKDENVGDLEVVFVSSDRDPSSFRAYFSSMPWLALPFEDRARQRGISTRFGIRGIPALVVLDAISGSVVSQQNARNDVHQACRGGDDAVKLAVANWISNLPEESMAIMESIELSLQVNVENEEQKAQEKANEYLVRKVGEDSQDPRGRVDPAERVKFHFAQLVAAGRDPTTAAAEAIKSVAEEQKLGKVPFPSPSQLETGPMNNLPWRSVCSLDCVSLPNRREGDRFSHIVFSDATNSSLLRCPRRIEGINLLWSSSSGNIVGIQSLYGDELQGEEHFFTLENGTEMQAKRGDWSRGEQKADLVSETAAVHAVEGVMGTSGVKEIKLIYSGMANPQRENGCENSDVNGPNSGDSHGEDDSFPFCLMVPRDLELLGFHGVATPDGMVSLGLVCGAARNAADSLQRAMSAVTVHGDITDVPANVAKCATQIVRLNGNDSIRIVVSTATKYLDNALKEPSNPKFRTFKLNNKVSDRICQVPGGLDMIISVGFAISNAGYEFIASLPLAANLEAMRKILRSLMEYFEA